MEITDAMKIYIEKIVMLDIEQSYPKVGKTNSNLRSKIYLNTIIGLENQRDDIISRAFRLAMDDIARMILSRVSQVQPLDGDNGDCISRMCAINEISKALGVQRDDSVWITLEEYYSLVNKEG